MDSGFLPSLPSFSLFLRLLLPFSLMDNAGDSCTLDASHCNQHVRSQSGQPTTKLDTSVPPASPVAKSDCSDTNVTMATVPEEGDEIWSDAQEAIEVEERAEVEQQGTEGADRAFDTARTGSRGVMEQPDADDFKLITQVDKSASDVVTVEQPPSPLPSPIDTSEQRTHAATPIPPSLHMSSAPSSPTASASAHTRASSRDGPSSFLTPSASARPVSPSPTQSSHGLERRQSRRRSTIDVCRLIALLLPHFTSR